MKKIVIDAGHGGWDNGASFGQRREKDDNLLLALAVGEVLSKDGFDVEYTREEDIYQPPFRKASIGNEKKADLFVSIHRNSSVVPEQYQGVETLIYSKGGLAEQVAEKINLNLEEIGYINLGVEERPNLIVLNSTEMPAVLVEAGFINSTEDNELFTLKFEETAKAIAAGIKEGLSSEDY